MSFSLSHVLTFSNDIVEIKYFAEKMASHVAAPQYTPHHKLKMPSDTNFRPRSGYAHILLIDSK